MDLDAHIFRLKAGTIAKFVSVWFDTNRNGFFESEELVFTGNTNGTTLSGNIKVPFNIQYGPCRMRIAVASSTKYFSACQVSNIAGEIEDYRINLLVTKPVTNTFTYYVNSSATGLRNGATWQDAFTTLSDAIAFSAHTDTIKVAAGKYTPGNLRSSTFNLRDSVILLGGYPATGNPGNADRDPAAFPVILGGEIGGTQLEANVPVIITANSLQHFYVDGFILENCYNGSAEKGPVSIISSAGTFKNIVVRNNYNTGNGCGLNISKSKVNFTNCFFERNTNNNAPYLSAALFNFSLQSDIQFINTVIVNNRSQCLMTALNSKVKFLNCTVFKNYGVSTVKDTSSLVVENSIFYYEQNDSYVDRPEFEKDIYSSVTVHNSIVQVYGSDKPGFQGQYPKFADTSRIAGPDGKYFTADDGVHPGGTLQSRNQYG